MLCACCLAGSYFRFLTCSEMSDCGLWRVRFPVNVARGVNGSFRPRERSQRLHRRGATSGSGSSRLSTCARWGLRAPGSVCGDHVSEGRRLHQTGEVDPMGWNATTGPPPPGLLERSLYLMASFDGHGFTRAQRHFGGAGMAWGIVGFNLQINPVQGILGTAPASVPALISTAFGSSRR